MACRLQRAAQVRRDIIRVGCPALAVVVLGGCAGIQSSLEPSGPAAASIATLWWVMLAIATIVSLVVIAALVAAARRRRTNTLPSPADERTATRWVIIAGVAVPTVILVGLFVYTLRVIAALTPATTDNELTIQVTGWRWWWEVEYLSANPNERFTTANEIHIPVGRRVHLRLIGADVIHSFWVPRLHGKTDQIPGKPNSLTIQASVPGVYRGQCAEYCGIQHAKMAFLVIAHPPEEFAAWAAAQRRPAAAPPDPASARGLAVFARDCARCHLVRGAAIVAEAGADTILGPDLTHLADRRTLAAASVPNTKGHLAGWIANPQQIKPGNLMPQVPLRADEFHALLTYLETLR